MNRRSFLGLAAAATGALVVPGLAVAKRTFFLPPAGGWRQSDYTVGPIMTLPLLYGSPLHRVSVPCATEIDVDIGDKITITMDGRSTLYTVTEKVYGDKGGAPLIKLTEQPRFLILP